MITVNIILRSGVRESIEFSNQAFPDQEDTYQVLYNTRKGIFENPNYGTVVLKDWRFRSEEIVAMQIIQNR